MGTKNKPSKFDCYKNAEPDEPMFVLLGRDRHAASLVEVWALARSMQILSQEEEKVVGEALECARQMRLWHEKLGKQDAFSLAESGNGWIKLHLKAR